MRTTLQRTITTMLVAAFLAAPAEAFAAPNEFLSASPRRGNFGRIAFGLEVQRTFVITNVSNEVIDDVEAFEPESAAFYLHQESCTTHEPLVPGETCNVAIRFQPTFVGRDADTLFVWAFGCNGCATSIAVPLKGTGIAA